MTTIRRATDHHLVMGEIAPVRIPHPKPKPVKGKKGTLAKGVVKSLKKKRKKKTARQLLVRDLDQIIREIISVRDVESVKLEYKSIETEDGEIKSIKANVPQLGHIISRARMSVRWDFRNCHKQDAGDNLMHEFYPEVYITWYIKKFGLESWESLYSDSRMLWKYSIDDLETLYFELTEIQKYQQSNPSWRPYFSQKEIISSEWKGITA